MGHIIVGIVLGVWCAIIIGMFFSIVLELSEFKHNIFYAVIFAIFMGSIVSIAYIHDKNKEKQETKETARQSLDKKYQELIEEENKSEEK